MSRRRRGWLIAAIVSSVVGLVGSTVAFAAITTSAGPRVTSGSGSSAYGADGPYAGMMNGPGVAGGRTFTQTGCTVPSLPGSTVAYTAVDMGMGAGIGGSMMGGAYGDAGGPMRLLPSSTTVPAGQVSLVLRNAGTRLHEVVALPLTPGQVAGQSTVGPDDTVGEPGRPRRVHRVCRAVTGVDGTVPGGIATVTVTLAPGTYEIVCNLPGHYRAGMYSTLTVT
jgi:uncharacterized cupredoxin-like copper-binding protein